MLGSLSTFSSTFIAFSALTAKKSDKFLHHRRTFESHPFQHSVARRLCPHLGNNYYHIFPGLSFILRGLHTLGQKLPTLDYFFVMVILVMKLHGVLPPAVGKNVTVRNESLNQTTEAFIFCFESNCDSCFDWVIWSAIFLTNFFLLRISLDLKCSLWTIWVDLSGSV